jgi:superkiller protein 3
LRSYTEAIELFEGLLKEDTKYLPAVKGITEAHWGLAAQSQGQRLLGKAREHAQLAVNYLFE